MGVTISTAGRIYKGQKEGKSGEEGYLEWERFPYMALVKVRNMLKLSFYLFYLNFIH